MEATDLFEFDDLSLSSGPSLRQLGIRTAHDEVSLELSRKVDETHHSMGLRDKNGDGSVMREVIAFMIGENNRGGRYHNGGFYDYSDDGSKTIWPKLLSKYVNPDYSISENDIKDRLLFRQVIETLKCLDEGVLRSVADGNIGSIMGIGAPTWTGGFIQFVNTFGFDRFVERCSELSQTYGERFDVPVIVRRKSAEVLPRL